MLGQVSVVIPTKNRPDHLRRAVASVLDQVDVPTELIVVDDGSDEPAAATLASFAGPAVRFIRHDRSKGVSAARNAGVAAAAGEWVAFLDDDDLWAAGKLAAQLAAINTPNLAPRVDWACCACVLIDPADRITGWAAAPSALVTARELLSTNVVPAGGSGVVARTSVVRALGGFDESRSLYEDWDLWIRLALRGPGAAVEQPLVAYRVWQSTSGGEIDLAGAWDSLQARYAADALRHGVEADRTDLLRYCAYRALRSGRYNDAAAAYRELASAEAGLRARLAARAVPRLGPLVLRALARRDRRAVPPAVRTEAERWLHATR